MRLGVASSNWGSAMQQSGVKAQRKTVSAEWRESALHFLIADLILAKSRKGLKQMRRRLEASARTNPLDGLLAAADIVRAIRRAKP